MPAKLKIWVFWRFTGELWDAKFAKKSLKICQILQKSQFSGPKNLHWEIGSLLYVKWAWFCSQKHKIECLSSITFDFIGCWKCDKLKKVRNCESNTQFWIPTSSEQCFEIHRSSVPISSSRFANYEPFLRFHEPLFEEFQKNRESKERHFQTFVARFLMPL